MLTFRLVPTAPPQATSSTAHCVTFDLYTAHLSIQARVSEIVKCESSRGQCRLVFDMNKRSSGANAKLTVPQVQSLHLVF